MMNKLTFKIINYSDVVTNSSTLIHIATAPFYRRKPMKFVATNFKGYILHFMNIASSKKIANYISNDIQIPVAIL